MYNNSVHIENLFQNLYDNLLTIFYGVMMKPSLKIDISEYINNYIKTTEVYMWLENIIHYNNYELLTTVNTDEDNNSISIEIILSFKYDDDLMLFKLIWM